MIANKKKLHFYSAFLRKLHFYCKISTEFRKSAFSELKKSHALHKKIDFMSMATDQMSELSPVCNKHESSETVVTRKFFFFFVAALSVAKTHKVVKKAISFGEF